MRKILIYGSIISSIVIMISCGKTNKTPPNDTSMTEESICEDTGDNWDEDLENELNQNKKNYTTEKNLFIMATEKNFGSTNDNEFHWDKTIYKIYYDGNITRKEIWKKNGDEKTLYNTKTTMPNDTFAKIYSLPDTINNINENAKAYDGTWWEFYCYDENGEGNASFGGRIYGIQELEDFVEILNNSIDKTYTKI